MANVTQTKFNMTEHVFFHVSIEWFEQRMTKTKKCENSKAKMSFRISYSWIKCHRRSISWPPHMKRDNPRIGPQAACRWGLMSRRQDIWSLSMVTGGFRVNTLIVMSSPVWKTRAALHKMRARRHNLQGPCWHATSFTLTALINYINRLLWNKQTLMEPKWELISRK